VADSGIEWALYWIDLSDSSGSDESHAKLINLKNALARENSLSGRMWSLANIPSTSSDKEYRPGGEIIAGGSKVPSPSENPDFDANTEPDFNLGFTIGLTRMGKLPVPNMSQGGAYTPAAGGANLQAPDLWAIRSDAQVKPKGSSITFTQAREMWVSTPVR
jgi:hypothetical protein